MTDLSSFASSRLCVRKKQCVTQSRKVARRTRAMHDLLTGKFPVKATELEEIPHDRSFFRCVFE